jgi:hypothetical protein
MTLLEKGIIGVPFHTYRDKRHLTKKREDPVTDGISGHLTLNTTELEKAASLAFSYA